MITSFLLFEERQSDLKAFIKSLNIGDEVNTAFGFSKTIIKLLPDYAVCRHESADIGIGDQRLSYEQLQRIGIRTSNLERSVKAGNGEGSKDVSKMKQKNHKELPASPIAYLPEFGCKKVHSVTKVLADGVRAAQEDRKLNYK